MYRSLPIAALVVCVFLVGVSFAQPPVRDPEKENPLVEELRLGTDDATAEKFKKATEALDAQKYEEAERLYTDVLKAAPEFEPALRRLGYVYVAIGNRAAGLEVSKKALDKNRSVDNLVGRASTLLSSNDPSFRPSKSEINDALTLSKEAWQKSEFRDEGSGAMYAQTLLMAGKIDELKTHIRLFKEKFPDGASTAYFNAVVLADDGDFEGAEAEIARSRSLGASEEAVAPLLGAMNQARDEAFFGLGRFRSLVYPIIGLIALWAVGLVALFVIGRTLSQKTLRSIEDSGPNDITGQAQASLKSVYRKLISIAGVYYYISQPFVIFLVIATTLGVIFFFLWVGHIPVKLLLVFAFIGAASIFYMIKSLVTRTKLEDPGRSLTEAEAPGLWKLVRDVATTVNTRPVTEIRLTHATDLAVYERGSFRAKVSDQADRILILGAANLNGFDQNAFRAVLAHEYGHFSNRDTAGGDIAYRVNVDIMRVAQSMIESETATFYNLGFQFLRLFHFLFRRITHGASRLQEVLADRVAAHHFGADAFREGLRHVIRRELEFNQVANKEVSAALGANRAIANLYELSVEDDSKQGIEEEFARALEQGTSDDDTHPSPRDRFRYIEGAKAPDAARLEGEVWDLFADRPAIVAEMQKLIENLVRPYASTLNAE